MNYTYNHISIFLNSYNPSSVLGWASIWQAQSHLRPGSIFRGSYSPIPIRQQSHKYGIQFIWPAGIRTDWIQWIE